MNAIKFLVIVSLVLGLSVGHVFTPTDAKDVLKKHNEYRKQELASDMYLLHWNVSLQERADHWSQQCHFKHERNPDVGENLYFDTDHENQVFLRGMDAWHKEKSKWGYTSHSCRGACHFTQIVWGYTTTVGCSANVCPSLDVSGRSIKNAMLFVCYYYPRGNFIGNFPYARGHPCSECAAGDTCAENLCVSSGPESKRAPDFVKKLTPKTPLASTSSSRSFQAFQSLIQQFSSATSHGAQGHQQLVHHRSEHYHQQHQQHHHQHHQHFKSESILTSASASHSYSELHRNSSQHHRQTYHSSQHHQQQHVHGQQQHHQQQQQQQQQLLTQQQQHQRQYQQREESYLFKEQLSQQILQQEEKRQQEIMEQQQKNKEELEKRRQAVIEEQQRQAELEKQRQHLLTQKRLQEEWDLQQERLKQHEEERKRQAMARQAEQERRQKLEEEYNNRQEQQRIQQDRYKQLLQENSDSDFNRPSLSQQKSDKRVDNNNYEKQLTSQHPTTESSQTYNIRNRNHLNEYQERTTYGLSHDTESKDRETHIPIQLDNARGVNHRVSTNSDDDYRESIKNHQVLSAHAHGSLTAQSSTLNHVVQTLSHGSVEQRARSHQEIRNHDDLLPLEWSRQMQHNGSYFQYRESSIGTGPSNRLPESESPRQVIKSISNGGVDEDTYGASDRKQQGNGQHLSKGRQPAEENRTKHLKNRWRYRQTDKKKIQKSHPHKVEYIMEADGRRCVDRHEDCVRWAPKCYKSSIVTLSCPLTCGKCGLHLTSEDELQGDQTTENSPSRLRDLDARLKDKGNKSTKRELTVAERKARREQRRLERERNAPSALIAYPGAEIIDSQSTQRSTNQRQRKEGRRKKEKLRNKPARKDVCRDDPKHIKSCIYWAKKGFCLDNQLLASLYCRHSCNSCR